MATYKEIQAWVKDKYNFVPKTCWIAHVKEISRLLVRKAPNRIRSERLNLCPEIHVESIQEALRFFEMIK